MTKQVIEEFSIQMTMTENVMKKLTELEKKLNPVAKRLESRLNKTFSKDYAKQMQPTFNRIDKMSAKTSQNIHKNLTKAFNMGNVGSGMFNTYTREGETAAKRVALAMRNASRAGRTQAGDSGLGGVGRPRPATRPNRDQMINSLHTRQTQSALYGNMQIRNPEQAQQYHQRLTAIRNNSLMGDRNVDNYRASVRALNAEYAQAGRVARAAASAQRAAAAEASTGLGALAESASPLIAGFVTLTKAIDYFEKSLEVGKEKTQAKTMMSAAFTQNAPEITAQIIKNANLYGQNETEAQKQAAALRSSMPSEQFDDNKIVSLLKNEQVFAHLTGVQQEGVGRFNYGLQQVAASPTLMAQDWNQITQAMPGIIKPLEEMTGTKNSRALRDYLKGLGSGAKVADLILEAMTKANTKANAYKMAQDNILSSQQRYQNAVENGQKSFFDGYEDGLKHLFDSMTNSVDHGHTTLKLAGEALGYYFDKMSKGVDVIDTVVMNMEGIFIGFESKFNKFRASLSPDNMKGLDALTGSLKGITAIIAPLLALKGTKAVAKAGARAIGGAFGRSAAAGSAEAAVAEGAGLLGGASIITALAIAAAGYVLSKGIWEALSAKFGDPTKAHGKATYAGGNVIQDSMVGSAWGAGLKAYHAMRDTAKGAREVWNNTMNAPMYPGQGKLFKPESLAKPQQPQQVKISMDKIQFAPLTLNIPMPDGSIYSTRAEIKDMISDHHETVINAASGTGGGWQNPGQNAGFKNQNYGLSY